MRKIVCAALVFMCVGSGEAWSQPSGEGAPSVQGAAVMGGSFRAKRSVKEDEALIEERIERAIDDMSFVTRPIARSRLRSVNKPTRSAKVKVESGMVTVVLDGVIEVRSKGDGSPIQWKRPSDGEIFTVTQRVKSDRIVQKFAGEDGTKTITYIFAADGSAMKMDVRVESPRITAPLKYALRFVKH